MPDLPDGRHWEMTGLTIRCGEREAIRRLWALLRLGVAELWRFGLNADMRTARKTNPAEAGSVCVRSVTRLVVSCAVRPSLAVLNLDLSSRRFQVREQGSLSGRQRIPSD